MMMDPRDAALKVREFYNNHEHARNTLFDSRSPDRAKSACLLGAFMLVTDQSHLDLFFVQKDTEFANFLGFFDVGEMVNWNNETARTKEDIIQRLDEKLAA